MKTGSNATPIWLSDDEDVGDGGERAPSFSTTSARIASPSKSSAPPAASQNGGGVRSSSSKRTNPQAGALSCKPALGVGVASSPTSAAASAGGVCESIPKRTNPHAGARNFTIARASSDNPAATTSFSRSPSTFANNRSGGRGGGAASPHRAPLTSDSNGGRKEGPSTPPASKRGPTSPSSCGVSNPGMAPSTPSISGRRVPSPSAEPVASTRSVPATARGVPSPGSKVGVNVTTEEKDGTSQQSRARKRNSYVQQLLTTPGCVLLIDNLEVDVQPVDVLGQFLKFCEPESIQSVHIPPPYPEMNRAIGYVVFTEADVAKAALAFMSRYFVVSARGRPWVASRCGQRLNEEDFGFPTISAFMGEAKDGSESALGGLRIITDQQQPEYNVTKRRRTVFEQHRKQCQKMFERHTQEERELEANPDLSLYH